MKKLLCAFLALSFVLAGCGSEKTEKIVCKTTTSVIDVTNEIEYQGEKIVKQTIINETSLALLGVDKETIESTFAFFETQYDMAGVTYTAEVNDEVNIVEKIVVDYTSADFKKLETAGLITLDEDKKATYISLEQTVNTLKSSGFVCE